MGTAELSAYEHVEDVLAEAETSGALRPGTRGWRTIAEALCASVLLGPAPGAPNQTWLSAILAERVRTWVDLAQPRSTIAFAVPSIAAGRETIVQSLPLADRQTATCSRPEFSQPPCARRPDPVAAIRRRVAPSPSGTCVRFHVRPSADVQAAAFPSSLPTAT
jgi:hypothetical protein